MNRAALYVYFENPNKVYGPFLLTESAREYAGARGVIARLTGNEILRCRVRVTAPGDSARSRGR